jgi:hypothetical protein
MKRLFLRSALFALPFVVLIAFVALVDPFECLHSPSFVSPRVKAQAVPQLHNPLWKIQKFKDAPVARLILGDSSMAALSEEEVREATGQEYFNFAYGGGTLAEAIDTYWYAAALTHLDAVYLGIGLINFNEYQDLNRVPEAKAIASSVPRYLTNRIVLQGALVASYAALTGSLVNLGIPSMSPDAFWNFQINEALPQLLNEYRYPHKYAQQLELIAADCRRNGTRLVIVIPPTQVELQQKVALLGRSADDERFKAFMRSLATVYDFNYPNALTAERANFSDPFHTIKEHTVIDEVWGNRLLFSRRTAPADSSATRR